jgi:very-short-patch-repair endonuclease
MEKKILLKRAKDLRGRMTLEEKILWSKLKSKQFMGLKFRRQEPIHRYIVDFICYSQKLIIEIDGEYHRNRKEYDLERDRWFERRGFRVLRFTVDEVYQSVDLILDKIKNLIN